MLSFKNGRRGRKKQLILPLLIVIAHINLRTVVRSQVFIIVMKQHNYVCINYVKFCIIDVVKRRYLVCCREGKYRSNEHTKRLTNKKRLKQKPSRKINDHCLAGMYVDEFEDGPIRVTYISAHTGHELGLCELQQLPLPKSAKETVALKLSQGIPAQRIIDGL